MSAHGVHPRSPSGSLSADVRDTSRSRRVKCGRAALAHVGGARRGMRALISGETNQRTPEPDPSVVARRARRAQHAARRPRAPAIEVLSARDLSRGSLDRPVDVCSSGSGEIARSVDRHEVDPRVGQLLCRLASRALAVGARRAADDLAKVRLVDEPCRQPACSRRCLRGWLGSSRNWPAWPQKRRRTATMSSRPAE